MVRPAVEADRWRIAEILVFAKRMAYRPIFQDDFYSFHLLNVHDTAQEVDPSAALVWEEDGILYYQGQNTGTETQLLIYGNKTLYDCFEHSEARIFFFRDGVFAGEKYICQRPFQENGKWIFPLKDK